MGRIMTECRLWDIDSHRDWSWGKRGGPKLFRSIKVGRRKIHSGVLSLYPCGVHQVYPKGLRVSVGVLVSDFRPPFNDLCFPSQCPATWTGAVGGSLPRSRPWPRSVATSRWCTFGLDARTGPREVNGPVLTQKKKLTKVLSKVRQGFTLTLTFNFTLIGNAKI